MHNLHTRAVRIDFALGPVSAWAASDITSSSLFVGVAIERQCSPLSMKGSIGHCALVDTACNVAFLALRRDSRPPI